MSPPTIRRPSAAYLPKGVTAYDSQVWESPDGEVQQPLWIKPEGPWEWEDEVGMAGTKASVDIGWLRELEEAAQAGTTGCEWDTVMHSGALLGCGPNSRGVVEPNSRGVPEPSSRGVEPNTRRVPEPNSRGVEPNTRGVVEPNTSGVEPNTRGVLEPNSRRVPEPSSRGVLGKRAAGGAHHISPLERSGGHR
ncbi:hypothetical protein T484DRAFT_1878391, partial [Baffinella frigidus]